MAHVDAAHEAKNITYEAKRQLADLQFSGGAIQHDGTLEIEFMGTLNNDMAGFYRSRYKPAVTPVPSVPQVGEYHFMFSTQFESCYARCAFPCFDEPNLKATFDFEIEIPEDQTALSNMPEKGTKKAEKDGMKVVSFERTPIMSTYVSVILVLINDQLTSTAPSMGLWGFHLRGSGDGADVQQWQEGASARVHYSRPRAARSLCSGACAQDARLLLRGKSTPARSISRSLISADIRPRVPFAQVGSARSP